MGKTTFSTPLLAAVRVAIVSAFSEHQMDSQKLLPMVVQPGLAQHRNGPGAFIKPVLVNAAIKIVLTV